MLNDMFISGLCGLVSLHFYPQWSRFLPYVYASVCQPLVGAACFPNIC